MLFYFQGGLTSVPPDLDHLDRHVLPFASTRVLWQQPAEASRLSPASVSEIFIPMGTYRRCMNSDIFPDSFRLLSYSAGPSHPYGTLLALEPSLFADARVEFSNGDRYLIRPVLVQESILNSLPMFPANIRPEFHTRQDLSDRASNEGFSAPPILPDVGASRAPPSVLSSVSSDFVRRCSSSVDVPVEGSEGGNSWFEPLVFVGCPKVL